MGNPFSKPKMPAPVPVAAPAPVADETALSQERVRRARSQGGAANILSSLSNATPDINTVSKQSKLLGG